MENGYSLSDIASATNGGMFGGSNEFIWIFALLILFGGNFGFNRGVGEFGQYATAASQNEILLGQKFDALSRQINQVGDGLASSTFALNNTITTEGRALQTQLSNCCCENQRNTDALRYDMATMFANTNANTTAQTQKILDALAQNKIETLQGQVNALQMQNAMAGVVRYPMASTYTSGSNPFCSCNCNCGNI